MKKNEVIQSIKIIALGLVLGLSISFAYAQINLQWLQPSGTPSAATNVFAPINEGPSPQSRIGALILGPDVMPAITGWGFDLTTMGFIDTKGILNTGDSFFLGNVLVGSTVNPLASVTIKSLSGIGERLVCSDTSGKLIICNAGICGTASGQISNSIPTTQTQLCSTGTASVVSGSGPWNWTCSSMGGLTNCNTATVAPGQQIFTSSGTFIVPSGVNSVNISAIGAGGGGGGGASSTPHSDGGAGGAGGDVKFNGAVMATGGIGGTGAGNRGSVGNNSCMKGLGGVGGTIASIGNSGANGTNSGGAGGVSHFPPYGNGGTGGNPISYYSCSQGWGQGAGGGGAGGYRDNFTVSVTPGSSIPVFIGTGGVVGIGRANTVSGSAGNNGYLKVQW